MSGSDTLAPLMEPVARLLLGEPNYRLSRGREIRFGTRGSLCVDRHRGIYHDHEKGAGGGVLHLIEAKCGLTGRDAVDWMRVQGLRVADVGDDKTQPLRDNRRQIVATYDYADEAGVLCFQVVRFDPKDFRQRRPDVSVQSGWTWSLKGARLVIYRLPEIIEAIANERVVYIVEGEKAVDQLVDIGVAATCSPMGACKWRPEYSATFAGAHVVILPDNDVPGHAHRDQVAAALKGVAASVRSLELPDLPPKGDVFDWVTAGGTVERLAELCEAAPKIDAVSGPHEEDQHEPVGEVDRLPLFPLLLPSEPYPLDALGPVLGEAACAIARKVQAPTAIAAQSVLATASLAAQAHADVLMPYGQRRPLSLYLGSVAASGDRKSSTDNEASWPITQREDALQEMYDREYPDWLVTHAAWSAEKKKIEGDRKLGFEDRRVALLAIGPEPQPPIRPVLTSAEPTFEGLVKSWPVMPPAQGVFSAEGGQFTGGHGMTQENRLRTAAGFSVLWDGKPITRIRALDGVSILKGRRLAMHLMVQPEAAAAFLSDPVLRDQGMLSRILVAAPESIAGTRLFRPVAEADAEQIRRYHARMLRLLEGWPLSVDRTQGLQLRELRMTEEAEGCWREFYNWIEEQCGPQGDLRPIRDFAAKAAEHTARIAGVLTIVEDEQAAEVNAETMTAAVRLTSWYVGEAVRLHGSSRTDPKLLQAQALLTWMRGQPDGECHLRDVLRLGPTATRTKKDAESALGILQAHGWVEEISQRPRAFRAHLEDVRHG